MDRFADQAVMVCDLREQVALIDHDALVAAIPM
jgi:hypothetical protein